MLTTRSMSWRTEVSRSGVPRWPRKYLLTDDVGGELAPEVGDLDVLLLEDALARLVGDAGGPVLPGDLVVGMDVRAGPAALEGQAAGALAGEAGAVRAGEAGRGGGGPSAVWAGCLAFALRSLAATGVPFPRAICSLLVVSDAVVRGSCRIAACRRCSPSGPGGRSRPADGAGGERVGRLGSISRPHERYAESWSTSTPKPQDVVVVRRYAERYMWWFGPSTLEIAFIHAREAFVHARRRCPPVRAPVEMGCPRVVHRHGDGTSVLIGRACR